MDTDLKNYILAIITTDMLKVNGGGCPVFLVQDKNEQNKLSLILARILGGIAHDLENGIYIIVKH